MEDRNEHRKAFEPQTRPGGRSASAGLGGVERVDVVDEHVLVAAEAVDEAAGDHADLREAHGLVQVLGGLVGGDHGVELQAAEALGFFQSSPCWRPRPGPGLRVATAKLALAMCAQRPMPLGCRMYMPKMMPFTSATMVAV